MSEIFKQKRAVFLLIDDVNHSWFAFINEFKFYKVFVCIGFDHNIKKEDMDLLEETYSNINFIKEDRGVARIYGYKGWRDLNQPGRSYAHEKALYFLSKNIESYDYVWMIDEDVFLFNENTLINIDLQYQGQDFLVRNINCEKFFNSSDWENLWGNGEDIQGLKEGKAYKDNIGFPRLNPETDPLYQSICSAVRISKIMLYSIQSYAAHAKRLFHRDYYLPMSSIYNDYSIACPLEMQAITGARRVPWKYHEINSECIFSPVENKKLEQGFYWHDDIRNFIFLNQDHFGTDGGS